MDNDHKDPSLGSEADAADAKVQTTQREKSVRVLLIDSQPIVLLGLKTLLTEEAGYTVTGTFSHANNITEHVKLQKPDIVVMDFHLPNTDGMKAIQQIRSGGGAIRIVILTGSLNDSETCNLVKAGIKGILLKEMPTTLILQCLQRVHAGGEWMERNSMKSAFEQILRRESEYQSIATHLSPSEMNLAVLIATGHNNKSAARQLNLSDGSARVYINRIYNKLNITNRIQLAHLLKEKNLI